ncbi:MAG: hypothetical protein HY023_12045 [Chloroflexi bacterium]|nr:hypothetical protein [Chloroflexota bacterium]
MKDCPAESGFPVFVYGDYLGDLKITTLLRVWRTAAIYEAQRGDTPVLLKVAHKGDDSEERLKREAIALDSLAGKPSPPAAFVQSFFPSSRPILPVLLPPYPVPSKRPYGEITFRGEMKFYSVFRHAEGKFLSDLMLENPQPWHHQAGWITITLADALWPLAGNNKCHLCLSPDMVLVDVDAEGHFRPLLLDLGLIVEGDEIQSVYDWPKLAEPGYTAPELSVNSRGHVASPTADVYSMGLLYYEMLAGKPAFESKLRRDELVREAVAQYRGSLSVGRPELEVAGVVTIVERAIAPVAGSRFANVLELANALAAIYGRPPREKRPVPRRLYVLVGSLVIILATILILAAFILLRVLLSGR